jgi:glycolate oxidase FAD binding subunit
MRLSPTTTDETVDAVMAARADHRRLRICGNDSKAAAGVIDAGDAILDMTGLDKIIAYEPDELVLTVEAGVRLDTITELLAARGQHLAFEPPLLQSLFGTKAAPTIGGVIATNLAGPRRIAVGGVRDHFLGFEGVNGLGIRFRAGGRVVKNVTGFDLPKLLAGSWGTLAALTQVTLKVMPKPSTEATLVLDGLGNRAAIAALIAAQQLPVEVTGAAHLPAAVNAGAAATLMRIEGFAPSVAARAAMLRAALGGSVRQVDGDASRALWRGVSEATWIDSDTPIWRLTVPATAMVDAVEKLCPPAMVAYDWGGALAWVAMPGAPANVHRIAGDHGGSALRLRGGGALFAPAPPVVAALDARVRASFDPDHIFADRMRGLD